VLAEAAERCVVRDISACRIRVIWPWPFWRRLCRCSWLGLFPSGGSLFGLHGLRPKTLRQGSECAGTPAGRARTRRTRDCDGRKLTLLSIALSEDALSLFRGQWSAGKPDSVGEHQRCPTLELSANCKAYHQCDTRSKQQTHTNDSKLCAKVQGER